MSNKLKRSLDKEKMISYIDQFLKLSGMDEDQLFGFCYLRKVDPSLKNRYNIALELSIAILEAQQEELNKEEVTNG